MATTIGDRTLGVPFVDFQAQQRTLHDELLYAVSHVLEGMDFVLGPNVRAFEAEFATYCHARYAIGAASGTDALQLALRACGIGPGDEVITTANGFVATAEAIALIGAVPVFVDVDPHTCTLDPWRLEAAIGPFTRGIVPVHLFGQMADMDTIMAIARHHGMVVVEDARQAHGAQDRGRPAGSMGDAAAFSFSTSKNLGAYGEAGAVTTNSRAVAQSVRLLRDHGSLKEHEHLEIGMNSRMDELQAAVLRVKLPHLDAYNEQRQAHARMYEDLLADTDVQLPTVREGASHAFNLYVIQTDERDRVHELLLGRGVATAINYPVPIHEQPAFSGVGRVAGDLRATERLADRVLSLPMYPELEASQLLYVANCLRESLPEPKVRLAY